MSTETCTKLHSYISIFEEVDKIVIPIIQRDYAQGRRNVFVDRVRAAFLDSLYEAIENRPTTLDFIYGDIDEERTLIPLDGQQRLTTLFLLHWYAAKREHIAESECSLLENFSYETRPSARVFCEKLVKYQPTFLGKLSEEIVDQNWFPLGWKKDPTVRGMLVMLDAIQEKFRRTEGIWEKLQNGAITFHFLPLSNMGLTDELYIKMNSRGKPLTDFEHFKAELERSLREVDPNIAERVSGKIDRAWADMLWQYRDEDHLTDRAFLRYFRFVCDILYYLNDDSPQGKTTDWFSLISEFFSVKNEHVLDNVSFLEEAFDCWTEAELGCTPKEFFSKYISYTHAPQKILNWDVNILRSRLILDEFALNRTTLLYAVVTYLRNKSKISEAQFVRRLRIINNLIRNSTDEISDSKSRQGGNRMPAILRQVNAVMLTGKPESDEKIGINFNAYQVEEERKKLVWTEQNPALAEELFALEDHEILYGQIGIVGLDHPELFARFHSLFNCDLDHIDCALMAIGNYAQKERTWRRYQLGSAYPTQEAWKNLFHRSAADNFEKTKQILHTLLSECDNITNEYLLEKKNAYLSECERIGAYDWRYYYIKYAEFRPRRYGKYLWGDIENRPYEMSVLWTASKESENAYQPFLRAIGDVDRNDLGRRIVLRNGYVRAQNDCYAVYDMETGAEKDRLMIPQNDDGIDTEDRIKLASAWLAKYNV